MSLWDFSLRTEVRDLEAAARAILVSTALLRTRRREIFGVGLAKLQNQVYPLLLSSISGIPNGLVSPGNAERVLHVAAEALGAFPDWLKQFRVWRAEEPTMLAVSPGGEIVGPNIGTIGCEVRWGQKTGFLTAGHVGNPLHANVYDNTRTLGTVVYTNDPKGNGSAIEDDVAVIEYAKNVGPMNPRYAAGGARGGESATILCKRQIPATIMGYMHHIWLPSQNATVGDIYFTTQQVTNRGDSGSPALNTAGQVIGHVVAASPGFASYIQDVTFQLQKIRGTLAFAGLQM